MSPTSSRRTPGSGRSSCCHHHLIHHGWLSRCARLTNKRRRLIKVLHFDGTGLWLMTKRLEQGTFFWPRAAEEGQVKLELKPEAFTMLTDGIDMHGARPRGWYERGE